MAAMSEKQRLYGKLIIDFANAKTTDEAGLKYFENIQKIFNYQPDFIDKANNLFPNLNDFLSSLNESEKQCLKLISEKKVTEQHIASAINAASLKYDVYSKIFHIDFHQAFKYEDGFLAMDNSEKTIGRDLSVNEIKKMLRSTNIYPDSKEYNKIALSSSLPRLLDLGKQISSMRIISKKRYKKMSELEDIYIDIKLEHGRIGEIQDDLKDFLYEMSEKRDINESKIFRKYLSKYNNTKKSYARMTNTGIINEISFDQAYFTDRNDFSVLNLDKIYNTPIAYFIVAFLREAKNVEYLKRCSMCKKFYVAKRLISEQKHCSICSKKTRLTKQEMAEYQREYRQRIKSQKRRSERNAKVKKYIDVGYTRTDAEILASIET